MTRLFGLIVAAACFGTVAIAQTPAKPKTVLVKKPASIPATVPVAAKPETLSGRRYTNAKLGFDVEFPEGWTISDGKLEESSISSGIDLSLKAPESVSTVQKIKLEKSLKNVEMLVTAFRSGQSNGAIVRVSAENLNLNPQIKDAIDYFDAIRGQYAAMSLPPDFKYSETQAEQLGKWQFAFLELSSDAGKKRLYATVRRGHAILFSLSYAEEEDLQALRRVLSASSFALK